MRYVEHITLPTGHITRSSRSDIGDDMIRYVATVIEQALAESPSSVALTAPTPGCKIDARAVGAALTVTLYGADAPWAVIGVAPHSRVAPKLWSHLLGIYPSCTIDRPSAPWVAAALLVEDTPEWIADFERCVAWAWIER